MSSVAHATSAFTRVFDALWRGGGEKSPHIADLSPPGRSLSLASTLPSRGGTAPPMTL